MGHTVSSALDSIRQQQQHGLFVERPPGPSNQSSNMNAILSTLVACLCLVAIVAADDSPCLQFCTNNCVNINQVCEALPITAGCAAIKTQCDATCTAGCTCFDECVAECPAVNEENLIARLFTTYTNVGCQGTCAVRCQIKLAIQTATSQVAALSQRVQGLIAQISA